MKYPLGSIVLAEVMQRFENLGVVRKIYERWEK
jgi:hypothetical protein